MFQQKIIISQSTHRKQALPLRQQMRFDSDQNRSKDDGFHGTNHGFHPYRRVIFRLPSEPLVGVPILRAVCATKTAALFIKRSSVFIRKLSENHHSSTKSTHFSSKIPHLLAFSERIWTLFRDAPEVILDLLLDLRKQLLLRQLHEISLLCMQKDHHFSAEIHHFSAEIHHFSPENYCFSAHNPSVFSRKSSCFKILQ